MYDESIFTEQAEYLDDKNLREWHIEHPNEKMIVKKLCQGGAKLLTGPRGCGKTTLLLRAHSEMRRKKGVFSIYVNFKTSLKIEPLYKKNYNASYWFNQWLLLKIYNGIFESIEYYKVNDELDLLYAKKDIEEFISKIELGLIEEIGEKEELLTFLILENEVKKVLDVVDSSLCILLLDDAAHAFSKEQQNDFFEFFRNIKSRMISPKAAIYPGVTNFSASFHIGHDAEEINVWIKTSDDNYLQFMKNILKKRVSEEVYKKMGEDGNLLSIICYASFGIPRSLLNIVRNLYNDNEDTILKYNRKEVLASIKLINSNSINIYNSLQIKLPVYKEFVKQGNGLYDFMIDSLKKYNKEKDFEHQAVEIGIRNPIPIELEKVFDFLQYAGLLMYEKQISKGEKGRFSIYVINYGIMIEQNVFGGRQNIKNSDLAIAVETRNTHEYKRLTVEGLLEGKDIDKMFPLSLPPCPKCNTPRISANTKFCSECGEKLTTSSIFEELVNNDIAELPLTEWRVNSIKKSSSIKIIKDILMDTEHKSLRGVPGIGPFWTKKIYSYAEEFID